MMITIDLQSIRLSGLVVTKKWTGGDEEFSVNSFPAIGSILSHEKGILFRGLYLPQKLVLAPPLEREYKPFQKHVPSYYVILCPGCFVLP
jgi:hypothetical protein